MKVGNRAIVAPLAIRTIYVHLPSGHVLYLYECLCCAMEIEGFLKKNAFEEKGGKRGQRRPVRLATSCLDGKLAAILLRASLRSCRS